MPYRVLMTQTAIADFKKIARDILEVSKDAETASNFVSELRAEVGRLAEFPQAGALPEDRYLVSQGYRFLIHKDYLIFYTFEEETGIIYIKAAFHAKRDYRRVLKAIQP